MYRVRAAVLLVVVTLIAVMIAGLLAGRGASAATSATLNFQAKLMTDTGAIVSDGYYNVQFKLYSTDAGGTALWTETHLDVDGDGGTTGDDYRVRVKNGYLTVNLGSRTGFPGTINWDQGLWITMNVGGTTVTASPTWNGEMSPRLKLTGVPYAFRAGQLATGNGSLQSTLQLIQATSGSQTFQILDRGAAGTYSLLTNDYVSNAAAGTTAVQLQGQASATAPVLALKGGATPGSGADLLRLKDSSDQTLAGFDSAGQLFLGRAGASGATGSLKMHNASNANAVTIQSGVTTTGYTLTLPVAVSGNAGYCLADTDGSGTLGFTDCSGSNGSGSGSKTVGTIDSQTKSDNGAVIVGTVIYMQTADASKPGLVSTAAQTFAGDKTFNGKVLSSNFDTSAAAVLNIGGTNATGVSLNQDTTIAASKTLKFANGGNANLVSLQAGNNSAVYTLTLPTAVAASGECLAAGTVSGTSVPLVFTSCGTGGSGVTSVDYSGTANAEGGSISGSILTLHAADEDDPGLVSDTTQTFGGAKTFIGNVLVDSASTTAFQVQNASDNAVLTVDTSGNTVGLGKASTLQGKLEFYGSAGANTVSLLGPSANPASSFTMTLPSTIAASSECLKAGTVSGGNVPLVFGSCGGGSSSLQGAYDGTGTGDPHILLSSTYGGIEIEDGTTPVTGDLFSLQENGGTATYFGVAATGITLQNSSGVNAMTFENSTNHLKIYNPSDVAKYVDIYYDNTNNEAVFAAVGGTTRIGNGTGNINLKLTGVSDVIQATKTVGSLAGAYSLNDFNISQALTGGANAISGSVLNVTSTSTTSSTNTQNMLRLSQGSGTATGNLILGVTNAVTVFQVANSGATTVKDTGNSTTSFQVQNASSQRVFGVDASGAQAFLGQASTLNGKLAFYNSADADVVSLTVSSSTAAYALTLPTAAPTTGQCLKGGASTATSLEWGTCGTGGGGGSTRKVYLIPEYAGGVMYADGSNNAGTMMADYDATNRHNYYSWSATSSTLQDYDIVARSQVPSEYASGFGTFKIWVYGATTSTADNDVQVTVRDSAGTACASNVSVLPASATTWTEQSVTLSGCTFAANDLVTISVKAISRSGNAVRIGEISYQYTN